MVPTKVVLNGVTVSLLLKRQLLLKKLSISKKQKYSKKRFWVKTPILNRSNFDMENNLLTELLTDDVEFQNFTRLPFQKFAETHEKVPCRTEKWNQIAFEFQTKWQFPHALDGKHICIQAPSNEGSYYFNYKGFHSIVVLAHYNFIFIDCGGNGSISNGGIYKNSSLYEALNNVNNALNIPICKSLPGRQRSIAYCIIGDDAFALSHILMKLYPRSTNLCATQKIFNYRLCRPRRVLENEFGILCSRFRIFTRPMNTNLKTTKFIVMCCYALHNFLRPESLVPTEKGPMPDVLPNIVHERGNFSSNRARQIRDEFAEYFIYEGDTEFQWTRI